MSHLIRTTMRPDVEIEVDDAEYENLLTQGLIYDGSPPVEPIDPFDAYVADRLSDVGSLTRAAMEDIVTDPVIAAIVGDTGSDTAEALRAASVAAVEDAPTVSPAGAWDFAQSPTVAGVAIGTGSGSAPDATPTTKGILQLAGDLGGTATAPTVPGLAGKAPTASPTFTGTVSGVTKTHVGLGNVDNTSDVDKPVSTAQATADTAAKARANHTGTQLAATISDLTETVQDIVGALIVAGTNTTVTYDDTANTFTINATASGGGATDPEIVRDTIGGALVAGSGVQITVNDAGDTITIASTAVLPTRQVTAGTGLSGGGDLSTDRSLAVVYGSTAGTAVQGSDARVTADQAAGTASIRTLGTSATQAAPGNHGHTASAISDFASAVNAIDNVVRPTALTSAGIQAALDAAAQITTIPDAYTAATARTRKQTVVIPGGLYAITATMTIPQGVNVMIEEGAVLRVTSALAGPVFDTAVNVLAQDQFIDCGGIIDCNNLAQVGIYLRTFATFRIRTPRIYSPTQKGIVLGDTASTNSSYEAHVIEPFLWRPNNQTVPASSVGIHVQNATDCTVLTGSVNGYEVGVRADTGGNTFIGVHPWNYGTVSGVLTLANNMLYCFQETAAAGGNAYIGCIADTPRADGFRMAGSGARLIGCKAFLSSATGSDNVANAVNITVAGAVSAIEGLHVQGGNSTHRFAAEIVGDASQTTIVGTLSFDTVATTPAKLLTVAPSLPPDIYDSFVGANNAAPASARWTVTAGAGSGAGATIQTNRLRLQSGATGGYSANDRVSVASTLASTLTDAELLFLLEYGSSAIESYFTAGLRASASYLPGGSGYGIETSNFGTPYIQLNKYVAGVKTNLHVVNGITAPTGTKLWVRLRVQGTAIRYVYWPDGQGEPAKPAFSGTDSAVTAGGLATFGQSGGSAASNGANYLRKAAIYAL